MTIRISKCLRNTLKSENMTVKELKQKLNEFPEDMEVFIPSHETEYEVVNIESVCKGNIIYEHADGSDEEMEVVKLQEY